MTVETQEIRYTEKNPFPVSVHNWQKRCPSKTSVKTYALDPAGTPASGLARVVEIASYEPTRTRMVVQVIDAAVALTTEVPTSSPDTNTAIGTAPQGRYLPPALAFEYVFYGPDAYWINTLVAATRVTVTKEYE